MKKESKFSKKKKLINLHSMKSKQAFIMLIVMLVQIFMPIFTEMSVVYAETTETLLTTITATGKEQASYSVENVASVSFSYTTDGSSAYYNNGKTNWGWWGYGWTATVTPADGYTITKCVFYDDKDRTATDSEAPFVVETTEQEKEPRVNGTPILANQSKGITKIEVYGYVQSKTATITLNTNGGTINSGNITKYEEGTGATLPTDVTRKGYTFGGWYASSNFSGDSVTTISTAETGDKEYYAKWIVNTYIVTFDANRTTFDGTVTPISKEVTYGETYGELATVTEIPGFTFEGWYTTDSIQGDAKIESNTVVDITENTTLYAGWRTNSYNITVNLNFPNGVNPHFNGELNPIIKYSQLYSMALQKKPSLNGYNFIGWKDSNNNIIDLNSRYFLTEDSTVYAVWEPITYTITYKNLLDGTNPNTINSYTIEDTITFENPIRTGYTGSWNPTGIASGSTGNKTITAVWEINKYKVTFKDYDGSVLKTQENVEYNTGATAPSDPTREGYTFTGWDKSFDNVTEDLVVTAQYILTPGEVEVKKVEGNVGSATASLNNQNVEDLIELSDDEQNAIATGKDIYVFVEVDDISDSVSIKDKELVKTKLEDGSVVGMYLDINLFKQIEGENKVKVEETNGKIKISFEIPESLRSSNRELYIIRVHGTEVTKITPTVNGNTLTFETDRFSTYALAYADTVEETTKTEETTTTTTNTTSNPKTGDNIMFYISMLGLSIIGLAGAGLYIRKRRFD